MSQSLEVVKRLESNMFKLMNKCDKLKERLNYLESIKKQVDTQNKQLEKQILDLTKANENLKTANTILGSKEYRRETRLKINRLIREVDDCISQLSE